MTMTVKLDPVLEQSLRRRSAASGRPASELIREALQTYLASTPEPPRSAYDLGADLFGRFSGPADLSTRRKQAVAEVWDHKRPSRRG